VRREYDERGQKIQARYFGVDGEPISIKATRGLKNDKTSMRE
jgi:hypothetical protein